MLTATPLVNGIEDLHCILHFLDNSSWLTLQLPPVTFNCILNFDYHWVADGSNVLGTEHAAGFTPIADSYKKDPEFRSVVHYKIIALDAYRYPIIGEVAKLRKATQTSDIFIRRISKKYFRPGGMAPSELTRSIRAVRDTLVAKYSAPGLDTMHRIAYRPPIAVSPFLLTLSVSNFKCTLWHWWPIVTIRRNGFIGNALASGLQCDGWRCENCNSLFTNYTHHSKLPDLCGYWQSISRSVRLLSYY